MSSQAGISGGSGRQFGVGRDDPGLPLPLHGLLAQRVPAGVEPAGVPVRPLLRHVVRRVGGARGEVDEERLVRHQRLLLTDPLDRPIGHVLGEVVPLLRGPVRLDRHGVPVDRRRPLVRLGADEAVEVLEPAAPGRPRIERAHRAGLPHRHLVALAELGGGVAVQLQRLRQRRLVLRADRAVPGRRRGDLGDPTHPHRMMVPTGQQRLPGRRTQRRRVEPGVAQPTLGEPLEVRRVDRAAERRRRTETRIIEQDHQHVRRTRRRPQRNDRRKRRVRVLRVIRRHPDMLRIRNGQNLPPHVLTCHCTGPFSPPPRCGSRAVARECSHHFVRASPPASPRMNEGPLRRAEVLSSSIGTSSDRCPTGATVMDRLFAREVRALSHPISHPPPWRPVQRLRERGSH